MRQEVELAKGQQRSNREKKKPKADKKKVAAAAPSTASAGAWAKPGQAAPKKRP
jgi:hypothetical protein